jgi:type I restriction enzyme S subunit
MEWPLVQLESVVSRLTNGFVGPTRTIYRDEGIPYLLARQVKDNVLKFDGRTYVSDEFNIKNKKSMLKRGDVLLVQSGHIGHSAVVPVEHEGHNCHAMIVITPKPELLGEFLSLYFNFLLLTGDILKIRTGSTVPHLTCGLVKELQIPLPALEEQKRIVTILDQAFADIEQARAKTELNLKNARELFESYLQEVFSERSDGSPQVALSEITECISDGDHAAPPKSDEGIPFITISNINKSTNEIDFSDTFKVPNAYYSALKETRRPKRGDVLYTVTGSYGIPVIVRDEKEFCFQRHIGLVRPNKDVDSDWLYYLLMSPQIFRQADEGATGTAQKTVSLKLLRGLSVPDIPLITQKKMVNDLNSMYKKSKTLEKIYISKLLSLEELKKSILQKAFTGQLINNKNKGVAA